MDKITYKSIKKIPEVNAYIEQGNRVLGILGYTEHSRGHAVKVAETAGDILEKLGYNEHTVELAQIAGYMFRMKISQQLSVQSVSMMKRLEQQSMLYRQH